MKKADFFIILIILIIAAGLYFCLFSFKKNPGYIRISVDAKEYKICDLNENQTVSIEQNGHKNVVVIKDKKVYMEYSDCENQICVRQGEISKANQTIVCLPNRVVVEFIGESDIDAVVG